MDAPFRSHVVAFCWNATLLGGAVGLGILTDAGFFSTCVMMFISAAGWLWPDDNWEPNK
jgi:hypothetical protein